MLSILPKDITDIIFSILPITDKRNLIRCNQELNLKTNLMMLYEKQFMAQVCFFYKYHLPTNITKLERLTLEMIYDNYIHLIPDRYICNSNKLCNNKFMHFYCVNLSNIPLLEKLLILKPKYSTHVAYGAAYSGNLELLKWARKNANYWKSNTCSDIRYNDNIDALKWTQNNGYGWDSYIYMYAAENGHIDVLKWLYDNGEEMIQSPTVSFSNLPLQYVPNGEPCKWDFLTCRKAALNGHLHVLIWVRENGCNWDSYTCSNASLNGHLHVLIWARENGCDWDCWTCSNAALNGHLDVLIWARENGC